MRRGACVGVSRGGHRGVLRCVAKGRVVGSPGRSLGRCLGGWGVRPGIAASGVRPGVCKAAEAAASAGESGRRTEHALAWVVDAIMTDSEAGIALARALVRDGAQYGVGTVEAAFVELCDRAHAQDALSLFEELQQQEVFRRSQVSARAYVALILGLAEAGDLEHALNVGGHWFASVHKGMNRDRDLCNVDGESVAVDEALVLAHATVGDVEGVVEELEFMVNVCRNGDLLSAGFIPAVLERLRRTDAGHQLPPTAGTRRACDPDEVADAAEAVVRLAFTAGAYPLPLDAQASLRAIFAAAGRDSDVLLASEPLPLPPAFPAVRGGVMRR